MVQNRKGRDWVVKKGQDETDWEGIDGKGRKRTWTGWDGIGRDWMGKDETDGTGQNGIEWAELDWMDWDVMGRDSMGRDGSERDRGGTGKHLPGWGGWDEA